MAFTSIFVGVVARFIFDIATNALILFGEPSFQVGVIRVYGTAEFEENLSRNTEF